METVDRATTLALEFIHDLRTTNTLPGINRRLHRIMGQFGFDRVTVSGLPQGNETAHDTMLLNTRPDAYIEEYLAEDHLPHDPVLNGLFHHQHSYSWDDVMQDRRLQTSKSGAVVAAGRSYQMCDGLVVPVHGLGARMGFFSVCGFAPDISPAAHAAMSLVGMFTFQNLARLQNHQNPPTKLTAREKDVLSLAACGLTDREIGERLTLSCHTVDDYMRSARHKLGVRNRVAAVVQSIVRNEIQV